MSKEIPGFFLNRDQKRLYGILHRAESPVVRDRVAVVYCAPIFEEKLWSHRVGVNFARFLAEQGIDVLRFDYFGDGESEGLFEEASVSTRVNDIHAAVEFCRRETGAESVFLVGLSFGATLALAAAETSPSVAGVVAWAPVMNGERYIGDQLRIQLTAQMVVHRKILHDREELVRQILAGATINVEGYEIGKPLYQEMVAIDTLSVLRTTRKSVLVLQIAPAEKVDSQYAAIEKMHHGSVSFGAVRELKFWTQQKMVFPPCIDLFRRSADWITSAVAG